MSRSLRARAAVAIVAATAGIALRAQNPRDRHNPGPEPFSTRVIASGLANPWEITWGPDGRLWVTERTAGRVIRLDPADGSTRVALTLDEVYQSVDHDGLMGLALHPDLLAGRGRDHVFVAYTYDADPGPNLARRLRIRRYTYDASSQVLKTPVDVLDNLPAHDDHGGGRLLIGPDRLLYLSRGDLGANFLANYCMANRAQDLPSAAGVRARDWSTYQGKILRITLEGSIPADNPTIAGVRSHIYSYGHRNPQGLVFSSTGLLYASEHGPSTDDELNLIVAGGNYGWPNVAGYRDDLAYVYANWSASAPAPCRSLKFDSLHPPPPVPQARESSWQHPDFVAPLVTLFTVPASYDFATYRNATIAPASIDLYTSPAIPGWASSVLIPGLRSGAVYRLNLTADGRGVTGKLVEYFRAANRYRDLAISPDGRRIFVATDDHGGTLDAAGQRTDSLANPGAILEFTYAPVKTIR